MGATQTTSSQYLALDHQFSLPWIVLITAACAVVLFWTLYRERRILGSKTTSLFGVLRLGAIATVLWMLLAPTNVLEESTSTPKAVAILTDVSASMSTVDPVGTSDELRWAASQHAQAALASRTAAADRAIAALGVAYRELNEAVEDLEKHGAESAVIQHVRLASRAVDRAKIHLETIDNRPVDSIAPPETIAPLLRRLSTLLHSPEYDSLAELAEMLDRHRTSNETGWRESLPDLVGRTVTARRVFGQLADQLAAAERDAVGRTASSPISEIQHQARIERVASFLNEFGKTALAAVQKTANVRWGSFDRASRDLANNDEANQLLANLAGRDDLASQTNLAAALTHVDRLRQDQPVAATFVLSDVGHNQAGKRKPTEIAAQFDGTPVYVIPIGNSSRLRDLDLVSTDAPTVAMRNDEVVIEAHIEAHQCLGEVCVVQLLRDGQVVDFRNVLIDSDSASRSVRFDQRVSEVGKALFQIAIEPLDGEMTQENNFDEVEINVTRSDIKVLLADELPRWEYRYLAQLFRRDQKVELDELLYHPRLIATGRRESTGTFPVTVDQWDQYDVVILGDLPPEHFPAAAQESLLTYLRTRGGTLVMIAGDRAMPQSYVDHPLEEVIPVRPVSDDQADTGGYAFRVTEQGRSHAALMIGETEQATRQAWDFVNRFSPLHQVSRWRDPLPTARSLIAAVPRSNAELTTPADASASSFLCWQPVGRGRIVYLSGPDTYRLRFLRGDQLHYRFWGQLLRWAIAADLSAGNRMVRIRTAKTRYQTDQTVRVEVELLDAEGRPVIHAGDVSEELHLQLFSGKDESQVPLVPEQDRPGHYLAEIRSPRAGVYQVQPGGTLIQSLLVDDGSDPAIATFTVQAELPMELVDTRCNRVLAGQVADLTGGQVLPPTAVAEILELTDLEPVVTHRVQRQPLWLRWRYLWFVFGCLQTEWVIRKWRGLS
ncbi:MAG: hypothetical protein MI861_12100 [Pirellulales bacterium]|nr:hypothetical protein [Pirellulales bacterium]